mmetsp:Transcript_16745/g.29325  ORF Transcript_16745/g.29325 Transcript_16745/m.29325 type:complete len:174 (+) Transcript_16745:90-611(+)|eukprot:CAMPEP_0197658184 /NCGR_PEP_ID=MMETSP1338-20131121/45089_1 /TAXON_ID=43686 ORGANISM="Pelagodinium beii, Strain RCC1491" /NCGR_SAMPLE_ID=MMETSP1338 /ASSEMBLY_ACC=CAM_ASM_000754 /LENGTH=173 /DNA_ID=CAMNT_0043234725 /DNA_START=89 /DNA_END=610 /DNA_ORIENTATION=-
MSATTEHAVGDVCPKRFGLNYDPPAIILEYLEVSTGKLFHRRVGLKRLRATADPARVAEKLRQKNRALLTEDSGVDFDQIVTLVKKLQESMVEKSATSRNSTPVASDKKFDYHKADLNKLTDSDLAHHKALMDVEFFKNQKKPSDRDFVYDVQVDFPEPNVESGWDSEDDFDD